MSTRIEHAECITPHYIPNSPSVQIDPEKRKDGYPEMANKLSNLMGIPKVTFDQMIQDLHVLAAEIRKQFQMMTALVREQLVLCQYHDRKYSSVPAKEYDILIEKVLNLYKKIDSLKVQETELEAALTNARNTRDQASVDFDTAHNAKKTASNRNKTKINKSLPDLERRKSKTNDIYLQTLKKLDETKRSLAQTQIQLQKLQNQRKEQDDSFEWETRLKKCHLMHKEAVDALTNVETAVDQYIAAFIDKHLGPDHKGREKICKILKKVTYELAK